MMDKNHNYVDSSPRLHPYVEHVYIYWNTVVAEKELAPMEISCYVVDVCLSEWQTSCSISSLCSCRCPTGNTTKTSSHERQPGIELLNAHQQRKIYQK